MKSRDLAEKIGAAVSFATEPMHSLAKSAFLLNLLGYLDLDDRRVRLKDDRPKTLLAHLLGVLRRCSVDVPEATIRRAHCDMVFPWSRVVVSAALYGEGKKVTPAGVPAGYGAA